ncbi:MAG: hypothetical protein R3D71_05605 [Rickettsiales bacterium]
MVHYLRPEASAKSVIEGLNCTDHYRSGIVEVRFESRQIPHVIEALKKFTKIPEDNEQKLKNIYNSGYRGEVLLKTTTEEIQKLRDKGFNIDIKTNAPSTNVKEAKKVKSASKSKTNEHPVTV